MNPAIARQLQKAYSLHQAGNIRQAENLYRKVLAKEPANLDANNLLGLLLLHSGRPALAVRYLEAAARRDPDNHQSQYNLGIAHAGTGDFGRAATSFGKAAAAAPGNAEILSALGNALRLDGRPADAIGPLEKAYAENPSGKGIRQNLSLALNDRGAALVRMQSFSDALQCFRQAVDLEPGNAEAQLNLGITLEQVGNLDDAASALKDAVKARPELAAAHYRLAHLYGREPADDEISSMLGQFERTNARAADRMYLAFGLGEAFHKRGEPANAFRYMQEGQRLKAGAVTFELEAERSYFHRIKTTFGKDDAVTGAVPGRQPSTAILIVGMPRSGTSLTEQIISSHSQVRGAGEIPALPEVISDTAATVGKPFPEFAADIDGSVLAEIGSAYLDKLGGDAAFVTDKSPMNFKYLGLIRAALPSLRIVHCRRHPLDTCLSIFMHPLADVHTYSHRLDDLGNYYRLYQDLMEHWRSAFGDQICDVVYEELVADTETVVRSILDYCGLPFERECLEHHENERVVSTPSAGQVRQPIYQSSIGRWKAYRDELRTLIDIVGESG